MALAIRGGRLTAFILFGVVSDVTRDAVDTQTDRWARRQRGGRKVKKGNDTREEKPCERKIQEIVFYCL